MPRRRPDSNGPPTEQEFDLDPLTEKRREMAATSLAEAFLDLDHEISRGASPSGDQIGDVTLRQVLQMLADPKLSEAARLKCLELLTALRSKKLVQKTAIPTGGGEIEVRMPS